MSRISDRIEKALRKIEATEPKNVTLWLKEQDGSLTSSVEFELSDRAPWQMEPAGHANHNPSCHDDTPQEAALPQPDQRTSGLVCSHCGLPLEFAPDHVENGRVRPVLPCRCTSGCTADPRDTDHGDIFASLRRGSSYVEPRENLDPFDDGGGINPARR